MISELDRDWIRTSRRGAEYILARAPLANRVYWQHVPSYYRWKIRRQIDHDAPLDPLKIVWVDPNRISRFSGRKNTIYDRWQDLGKVRGGNWDQRPPQGPSDPKKEHMQGVMTAQTIKETDLYRSFRSHFEDGVKWQETTLYNAILSTVDQGATIWRGSQSSEDILDRCGAIDSLYGQIKRQGYQSQFELLEKESINPKHVGYLDVLTDEITVDISRDGDLLLVDGRHRMCLAKVLELEAVPVVVLVRHRQWLERREDIYCDRKRPEITDHPDLAETVTENEHRMLQT